MKYEKKHSIPKAKKKNVYISPKIVLVQLYGDEKAAKRLPYPGT
jgi:hypothetical protein